MRTSSVDTPTSSVILDLIGADAGRLSRTQAKHRENEMLTPFTKILEKYRREAFSEADKGTRFEKYVTS